MNCVIDQGNTLIKCGAFESDELNELWTWTSRREVGPILINYMAKIPSYIQFQATPKA